MFKKIIIGCILFFISTIVFCGFAYLMAAFIHLTFNFVAWSAETRENLVIASVGILTVTSLASGLIACEFNKDNDVTE
jgi:hypothetical protein